MHALDATQQRYRLALRHVCDRQRALSIDLLSMASMVKVDLRQEPSDTLDRTVRAVRVQAPGARRPAPS